MPLTVAHVPRLAVNPNSSVKAARGVAQADPFVARNDRYFRMGALKLRLVITLSGASTVPLNQGMTTGLVEYAGLNVIA
jgi:hypothetical protein